MLPCTLEAKKLENFMIAHKFVLEGTTLTKILTLQNHNLKNIPTTIA
jgi:hypothetical protein